MYRLWFVMAVTALLWFTVIGCGGSYRSSTLGGTPLEEQERIIYRNVTLKASIAVMEHEAVQAGDLMKVRAKFKNTMGKLINAEIMVKFLDASGYEISDNWGWQPFPVEKGAIKSFERFAPSELATDYRIFLRLADAD